MRGQKHDTFSKEFREEAIRQAREERRPLTALARDLGVKYSTLRLWVKQAEEADGERPGRDGDLVAENRRLRAENHQPAARARNPKKSDGLLREAQQMRFQFIAAEKAKAQYPVSLLCRCLRVSRSGFYDWARRGPSARVQQDARLIAQLRLAHHSDRGIPYASDRFRTVLARNGIRPSMSRTGDCWDNAPVESFFSSFKAEASPDRPWSDQHTATTAIREYVNFYNHRRLHSTLDYQSPVAFEERLALTV